MLVSVACVSFVNLICYFHEISSVCTLDVNDMYMLNVAGSCLELIIPLCDDQFFLVDGVR